MKPQRMPTDSNAMKHAEPARIEPQHPFDIIGQGDRQAGKAQVKDGDHEQQRPRPAHPQQLADRPERAGPEIAQTPDVASGVP